MENTLYFAYGSNINLGQMEYRCPDASVVGPVVLDGMSCCSAEAASPPSPPRRANRSRACCGASRNRVSGH